MHHIMIICPEHSSLKESEKWLSRYGFQVNVCHTLKQANRYYNLPDFHLVLVDQEIINELNANEAEFPQTPPRIILDSRPSLATGINAMALGAAYYLPLPTDSEHLLKHVVNTLEKSNDSPSNTPDTDTSQILFPRTEKEEQALQLGYPKSGIIGHCPPMKSLFSDIRKVASTDVTVLIRGESGTGKELVAKALHNLSQRHNHPLISVNCAAIPENLIESELFGHEKGAFTGAASARDGLIYAADKGTLFLDEIGELPLEAQARLLRVLQEGEIRRVGAVHSTKVDIRLVTATHRNLIKMVKSGLFREDLYYRLYVMELLLPPLRERGDDISTLAKILLEKACAKHKRPTYEYNKEFNKAIREHHWPGNVRELENAIERAVILSPSNKIEAANLKISEQNSLFSLPTAKSNSAPFSPTQYNDFQTDTIQQDVAQEKTDQQGTTLDDYLKHFVLTHQCKMTETQIAHCLGISRKSLWERRRKLGIPTKVTK